MNVADVYRSYLIKVNKNDTNKNIKVNKGIFVKIYNEQAKVWLDKEIRENSKTYEKNKISDLLVVDAALEKGNIYTNYTEFKLPEHYFDLTSSYSIAEKGDCKNRVLSNWDFLLKNRNAVFQNENIKPSFEYEETLITISRGNILVFKTDFEIVQEYLTYYSIPREIDIEGYTKEDGTTSSNIDPDIDDKSIAEIVALAALETIRIFENPDGFQLAKDRVATK